MSAATGMMPELGSKISLISKADIRYEGRLFTVDPQECTIALANVRSFGTEDRETPYPIAPQPTVYDYILFRGSDIKDIRVVNNVTIPNDPAIMQMHLPPNQLPPQQQGFPPQSFPPMQPPQAGQYAPFSQMQGPPPNVANNNPLQNIPQQQQQQQQQQSTQQAGQSPNQSQQLQSNQQGNTTNNLTSSTSTSSVHTKKSSELSKVEKSTEKSTSQSQSSAPINMRKQSNKSQDSRSATPNARKSPTSDMGVQTNQRDNAGGNKDRMQRNQRNNNNMHHNHERRDSGRNDRNNERIERNDRNNERNNEMYENKGGYRQNNQRMQSQRGGYHNHNNRNNHMRGNQGGSGRMRAPNFYRPNNHNNQNKPNGVVGPQNNNQGRANPNNKNTLKFENEFDFEQANSKFEELRTQLAKLKVGTEENKNQEQVNGEVEKKDDSGNETGADHEVEGDDGIQGYDKNKSFFDNISCEASERSKGKQNRPDWRQERKINSETFGLSMNRRGNMRGRGYYRTQYNNRPNYRPNVPPQYRNSNNRNNNNSNNRNIQNNSGRTNNNNGGQQIQQPQTTPQPVAAKN